jgi:hypothetical protein
MRFTERLPSTCLPLEETQQTAAEEFRAEKNLGQSNHETIAA